MSRVLWKHRAKLSEDKISRAGCFLQVRVNTKSLAHIPRMGHPFRKQPTSHYHSSHYHFPYFLTCVIKEIVRFMNSIVHLHRKNIL